MEDLKNVLTMRAQFATQTNPAAQPLLKLRVLAHIHSAHPDQQPKIVLRLGERPPNGDGGCEFQVTNKTIEPPNSRGDQRSRLQREGVSLPPAMSPVGRRTARRMRRNSARKGAVNA